MGLVEGIKSWLCGAESAVCGRMGQFQYSCHAGVWPHDDKWKGISTSGDSFWQWILQNSVLYKMPLVEPILLKRIASEINKAVPVGCPIVDLGTGGEHAVRDKLAPIAKAVLAGRVVLVDGSHSLLTQARTAMRGYTDASITRILDDFLDSDNTQYVDCPALVTYTGITIGNLEADNLASFPPADELTKHIEHICNKSHGGYVLVTFDSSLDEETNKASYEEHLPFHLNFLDQAVAECGFPLDVRKNIIYRAIPKTWSDGNGKPITGTISHYAEFTKDAFFVFGGMHFDIKAGTRFLLKNSFKFSREFFTKCAEAAGATVMPKIWQEGSIVGFLLKAPAFSKAETDAAYFQPLYHEQSSAA